MVGGIDESLVINRLQRKESVQRTETTSVVNRTNTV